MSRRPLQKLYPMQDFGVVTGLQTTLRIQRFSDRLVPLIPFPHKHSFYHLLVITSGKGWHDIDFQRYPLEKGRIFLMKPAQVHSWQIDKKAEGFVIEFEEEVFKAHPSFAVKIQHLFQILPDSFRIDDKKTFDEIVNLCQSMLREYQERSPDYEILNCLELFTFLIRLSHVRKLKLKKLMNERHHQQQIWIGISLAILATIIWSGNFIISRQVHSAIPPITLNFYRWLTATLILAPFAWKKFIEELPVVKKNIGYFLLSSITGVSLFNTFVHIAGHHSTAINMALIGTTSSPIISVILARIFLHEKITTLRITGMIICITGILLLLSHGHLENLLSLAFTKGDWWMLAAAFTFAIYNVSVKKKPAQISSVNFLFTVFLTGTVLLVPFYFLELKNSGGFEINSNSIFSILYLGLGTSVICFLFWNIAITRLGAGRTALFGNLIPVFSSIGAVILLHEKISSLHLFSFIIVVTGLAIANFHRK